jgi:hypothetical protein
VAVSDLPAILVGKKVFETPKVGIDVVLKQNVDWSTKSMRA